MTANCLDDLENLPSVHAWVLHQLAQKWIERGDICYDSSHKLHGISYDDIFLKSREYSEYTIAFIQELLSSGWGSAVEVGTRIYVRDRDGKWEYVPKKRFWAAQSKLLWTAWRDLVEYCLPWGKYDSWCGRLMDQIDRRTSSGEFRYNPLTTPKSRRKLRAIYTETVFEQGMVLYNKEKGKPGRKPAPKTEIPKHAQKDS